MIKIPTDYIKDFSPKYYVDDNALRIRNQYKPKGLHKLFTKNHTLTLGLNSRILGQDYKKGISLNSLDLLMDVLDAKCGLLLDSGFIKDSQVSLIHVKNDVEVNPERLMNELSLIGCQNKYHRLCRDNSITYENKNKWDNLSTTIYGKHTEMIKNKDKYKGLKIDLNDFKDISRIETKFNDWRTVKKHFKTRNLEYILNQSNINYIHMSNILKGQEMEIQKLDLTDFENLTELSNFSMVQTLSNHYEGDIDAMKAFIRTKTTNPKHQYAIIDKMLPMVKAPKSMVLESIKQMKQELKE